MKNNNIVKHHDLANTKGNENTSPADNADLRGNKSAIISEICGKYFQKKLYFSPAALLLLCTSANAQGTWTQKADLDGAGRSGAVSFSIGTKGYIGTGTDISGAYYKDFWEWDQSTDTWSQKADFDSTERAGAVGFSIGSKGYIGTGTNGTVFYNDFWEWDTATNIWTKKADFTGAARIGAAGFSIGSKGYVGTGANYTFPFLYNDFWEWDTATNIWTQKTNVGGTARASAVGFSIGNKGYIGTGADITNTKLVDFWEYDTSANVWSKKADFGGTPRFKATGFSSGSKGYIGTGFGPGYNNDFWQWDTATNVWTKLADFAGTPRELATGFSIGTKGFIGTGTDDVISYKDFYEFCLLTLATAKTNVTCNGDGNSTATAIASGGAIPYTYQWSANANSQTTATATGLFPDTFLIIVNDSNDCNSEAAVVITEPAVLTAASIVANATCYNNDGTDTVIPTGGVLPYSYLWTTGDTTQIVSGLSGGIYFFTVTDANNCMFADSVVIDNSVALAASVCLVTVDSMSTKNVIVWDKPAGAPIDSYRIYRNIASIITYIASVPYSALSEFTDTTNGINPKTQAYEYFISVIDTCGNESALSPSHLTIHQATPQYTPPNIYDLSWTDYQGFVFLQYDVFRDNNNNGNWIKIDSVPYSLPNQYTDFGGTHPPPTDSAGYYIEARHPMGCNATLKLKTYNASKSNTASLQAPIGIDELLIANNGIQIHPNPNNGSFNIEMQNAKYKMKNVKCKIQNVFGEVVFYTSINNRQSTISLDLPEGIYALRVEANGEIMGIVKVIIGKFK